MANGQTIILRGPYTRQSAHRLIDKAPDGAVMEVSLPFRSIPQNKRMQAMLSAISIAKPQGRVHNTDQWKCIFMDAMGVKIDWVPSLDGNSVVNTGYRSSRLKVDQMGDLMTVIEEYAARHGIDLGDQ